MAVLLSIHKISKTFGMKTLFDDISFSIETGQKIGLIGPNGAGKSTLLKIIAQMQTADEGEVSFSKQLRVGYLDQDPKFETDASLFDFVLGDSDDVLKASEMISKLGLDVFDGNIKLSELSGGWQKRVALARELAKDPNLLLLDEPTNHLDVQSIAWLETFLARQNQLACLMITHDRLFLQNTCDYIFDLDKHNPDGLIKHSGTYAEFVDFKSAQMDAQRQLESARKNTLRRETEWLRRGAKARQTKQKARIERAGDLKQEVREISERNFDKKLQIDFGEISRTPKKLIEAKEIAKTYGDKTLFENFSFILGPRSRVGIIGRNGCGKSTLIRCLLGKLPPDSGVVWVSDRMTFSYFEQNKESLDLNLTVVQNICPSGDYVQVQGQPIFAKSYLGKFNFRSDQMDMPANKLSGGEKSRLLIARLMMQKDPVLILDEPTNDLDINSLEVLEESLKNFDGAVILVTHDRYFMDQVANHILAFSDGSTEVLSFANFLQWQDFELESKKDVKKVAPPAPANQSVQPATPKVRMSYKEKQEFETIEARIQESEKKLADFQAQIIDPQNKTNFAKLSELSQLLKSQEAEIEKLYSRWQSLSEKA